MRVLLTGSTGLLGSELLERLAARGHTILVASRRRGPVSARGRIETILRTRGVDVPRERVRVFDGSSGRDLADWLRGVGPVRDVIHSAASVKFNATREQLRRENLDATADLLRALDAAESEARFHYVSTAYVCGDRSGLCRENEGRVGQEFRQLYEESKLDAEEHVVNACARTHRRWSICRPSIIAGDSESGAAANFNGLLFFLRTLDSLTRRFRSARVRARLRIDLPCDPGATKNIVPVDWVAESMIRLVERDDSRRVYHLTHPEPIPHDGLARILSEVFQLPGLRLVPPGGDPSSPSSPSRATQQCVNGILGEYFPYLQGEPTFDRSNLIEALGTAATPPAVNREYIRRLVTFGRSVGWRSRPLEQSPAGRLDRGALPPERNSRKKVHV